MCEDCGWLPEKRPGRHFNLPVHKLLKNTTRRKKIKRERGWCRRGVCQQADGPDRDAEGFSDVCSSSLDLTGLNSACWLMGPWTRNTALCWRKQKGTAGTGWGGGSPQTVFQNKSSSSSFITRTKRAAVRRLETPPTVAAPPTRASRPAA